MTLTLTLSKTTSGVAHKFAYNNRIVSSHTLQMKHLKFDHTVAFTDETSVSFSGYTYIGNTADYNFGSACPLADVNVRR